MRLLVRVVRLEGTISEGLDGRVRWKDRRDKGTRKERELTGRPVPSDNPNDTPTCIGRGTDSLNRPGFDGGSGYWISTRVWSVRFVA